MNRTDKQYKQLIQELREMPLAPKEPEMLTQRIMDSIHELPQLPQNAKRFKIMHIVSGIAAILLIGFFIFESLKSPIYPDQHVSQTLLFSKEKSVNYNKSPYTIQEKIKLYSSWLVCHQEKKKQREQFLSTFQSPNSKN